MCGIAGIINLGANNSEIYNMNILREMTDAIAYRGPDDEQYHIDDKVALAFRRLAILDIENGKQPFYNANGSIVVIVNGEIYNYKELKGSLSGSRHFTSDSDCEVILHLYEEKGISFVNDLIGMFAICIWDKNKNKVYLIRDRFGIKPLYYSLLQNELIFSSEIKSLLKHPKCPKSFNWQEALSDVWLSGDASTNLKKPTSFFEGIENLEAGTYLTIDIFNNDIKTVTYWSLEDVVLNKKHSYNNSKEQWIEGYYSILNDSVQKCLQSDAEVGLFLSGGIDSVAIATLASKEEALQTFTVLSQSTFINEDAKYAHELSQHLKIPNHQVLFHTENDLLTPENYKDLLWICETPFCGPEQFYKYNLYRYAKQNRPGLKVMLTGQGSDEFNGGYSTLFAPPYSPNWSGFIDSISIMESNRLHNMNGNRLKLWGEHLGVDPIKTSYLNKANPSSLNAWENYLLTKNRDLQMYNCWHEDRIAAANHIENRVPFLDHRLVEWVSSIPNKLREELLWDKNILRAGFEKILDNKFINRPKVPFFYGQDAKSTHRMMFNLLKKNNYQIIEEAFGHSNAKEVLDVESLYRIIFEMENDPEFNNFEFLLRLVNMGLLSKMVNEYTPYLKEYSLPNSINIENWEDETAKISDHLKFESEKISNNDIYRYSKNIQLMREENNIEEITYIIVDGVIEFSLSKEDEGIWYEVFREFNGEYSIKEILDSHSLIFSDISKNLYEALEYNLLELVDQKELVK